MDEPGVPPPDSTSAAPDARPEALELRGRIRRADVASVCARAARTLDGRPPGPVACRCDRLEEPAMPAVDVLARLALRGRHNRQRMRLEHAPPALVELLVLCGLDRIADGDWPGDARGGGPEVPREPSVESGR